MTKNAAKRKRKNALINSVAAKGTRKTTTEVRTGPSHKVVGVVVKTRAKETDKVAPKTVGLINNVGTITPARPKRKVLILSHPKETIKARAQIIRTTPITRTTGVGEEEITITTIPEATMQADAPIHVHLSHRVAHKTSKVVVTKATTTPIPPAITMVVEIQRVEAKGTTTTGEIKIGINAAGSSGNPRGCLTSGGAHFHVPWKWQTKHRGNRKGCPYVILSKNSP